MKTISWASLFAKIGKQPINKTRAKVVVAIPMTNGTRLKNCDFYYAELRFDKSHKPYLIVGDEVTKAEDKSFIEPPPNPNKRDKRGRWIPDESFPDKMAEYEDYCR